MQPGRGCAAHAHAGWGGGGCTAQRARAARPPTVCRPEVAMAHLTREPTKGLFSFAEQCWTAKASGCKRRAPRWLCPSCSASLHASLLAHRTAHLHLLHMLTSRLIMPARGCVVGQVCMRALAGGRAGRPGRATPSAPRQRAPSHPPHTYSPAALDAPEHHRTLLGVLGLAEQVRTQHPIPKGAQVAGGRAAEVGEGQGFLAVQHLPHEGRGGGG